ncbi:hypothetical protein E3_0310 [Rhodococcus phage E3]|uniref:hypothetical protein n=1 Tax=Rhodococcus phage E3 TaxID=1007869 RepID=UPI0002C6CE37|nr:hypothetical protein M176_gp032 [Rhodococcus phage E3]AEQ20942.1 hypothetical protein E3_0310 [Rhodococcus phage E3]
MTNDQTPESLRATAAWWDERNGRGTLEARELRNAADDLEAEHSGESKQRLVAIRRVARQAIDDCTTDCRELRTFETILRLTGGDE